MKMARCIKCNSLFIPMSSKDDTCTDCRYAARTAKIGECEITETLGRCLPYIKGECNKCWEFVLVNGWVGWHSSSCENHAGRKLPGDDE